MTLNQIVKRIKEIAEAHEQINTFFFGDVDDFLQSDVVYPACFMGMPSETISGSQGGGSELNMTISLYFMDRTIQGGSLTDNTFNQAEVLSDMRSIALDIFSQIKYQKFSPQWNVDANASLEYFNESTEDYNAGVRLQINIKYRFTIDRCAVPSTYNYG